MNGKTLSERIKERQEKREQESENKQLEERISKLFLVRINNEDKRYSSGKIIDIARG